MRGEKKMLSLEGCYPIFLFGRVSGETKKKKPAASGNAPLYHLMWNTNSDPAHAVTWKNESIFRLESLFGAASLLV